jgi:hypothetical protein
MHQMVAQEHWYDWFGRGSRALEDVMSSDSIYRANILARSKLRSMIPSRIPKAARLRERKQLAMRLTQALEGDMDEARVCQSAGTVYVFTLATSRALQAVASHHRSTW